MSSLCDAGVLSGIGKGITASSIGVLMKATTHSSNVIFTSCQSQRAYSSHILLVLVFNRPRPLLQSSFSPQAAGLRVTAIKIDPYLNVDAGKLSRHVNVS